MSLPTGVSAEVLSVARHGHCSLAWLILNNAVRDAEFPVSGDCIAVRRRLKRSPKDTHRVTRRADLWLRV